MAEKDKELKPDVILKEYWENNEQFADLFNAVLFDGREEIKPEDLEEADSDISTEYEHKDYEKSLKSSRDVIKVMKKIYDCGLQLVFLGEENQEHIHYAMPMRVMGYDYGTYKKQYDKLRQKYEKDKSLSGDEYLSRMKKTDRLIPVITIVIYYGEQEWDGATTLHGMLNIPDKMKLFVNDYKFILVEVGHSPLKFHNVNNRDLFSLFSMMLDKNKKLSVKKQEVTEYVQTHQVSRTVIKTATGVSKCNAAYSAALEGGEGRMWSIFAETMEEGRVEGRAEGIIETGRTVGLSDSKILELLQSKLDLTLEKAQEYMRMFDKQTV